MVLNYKRNTNNIIKIDFLFHDCEEIEYLPDLSKWKINNITNLNLVFSGSLSLQSLPDISKWNIGNSVTMS